MKAWPRIIIFVCSINYIFYGTYLLKARCRASSIKKQTRIGRFMISQNFENILAIVNQNI